MSCGFGAVVSGIGSPHPNPYSFFTHAQVIRQIESVMTPELGVSIDSNS